uniref:Uncharacterized protein n=1 Tax=Rhizophora mucronata TaxID=61149 RepID=A0A2P2NC44_RHIMU
MYSHCPIAIFHLLVCFLPFNRGWC